MSCSRWLSIQSSLALATPVDSHCVSPGLRRFGATRTSIPSTPFNTRASLPCSRQIHRPLSERAPNESENYSGVGDGLGGDACSVAGTVAWLRRDAGTLLFCSSSILPMRSWRSAGTVREDQRGLFEELEQLSVSRPISVVPPMLSLFVQCFLPGIQFRFSLSELLFEQLNLVFGTSKPAQKESVTIEQEFFSYHRWIRSCLVEDEQIGEGFDVKRKLTLLRRRRSCRFNCDHFDGVTPGTLDIGKNRQHRQTNHNHCH